MEDEEFRPPTQPEGALEPPRKDPPTAVGTATPGEPPKAHPHATASEAASSNWLVKFVSRTLDAVDVLAITIRRLVGVEP